MRLRFRHEDRKPIDHGHCHEVECHLVGYTVAFHGSRGSRRGDRRRRGRTRARTRMAGSETRPNADGGVRPKTAGSETPPNTDGGVRPKTAGSETRAEHGWRGQAEDGGVGRPARTRTAGSGRRRRGRDPRRTRMAGSETRAEPGSKNCPNHQQPGRRQSASDSLKIFL